MRKRLNKRPLHRQAILEIALEALRPHELFVIQQCIMDGHTLRETGKKMSLSTGRVRQIGVKGLVRIRRALAHNHIRSL